MSKFACLILWTEHVFSIIYIFNIYNADYDFESLIIWHCFSATLKICSSEYSILIGCLLQYWTSNLISLVILDTACGSYYSKYLSNENDNLFDELIAENCIYASFHCKNEILGVEGIHNYTWCIGQFFIDTYFSPEEIKRSLKFVNINPSQRINGNLS